MNTKKKGRPKKKKSKALAIARRQPSAAVRRRQEETLRAAISLWAGATTGSSVRRRDEMLQKKRTVIAAFFRWLGKRPAEVTPGDVQAWQEKLKRDGLRPATIYARVSFLSSFYNWAQRDPRLRRQVRENPALLARPKAPTPYQTESSKAWTDEELQAIVEVVSARAATGDLVGKRDLAILLLSTSTGWRREEVIGLRGRDTRW